MSWDWDKLQEKRRTQGKPQQKDGSPNPFGFSKKGGLWGSKNPKQPPIWLFFALLLLVWLGFGLFFVGPQEVGVVTRLGRFNRLAVQGANFKLPYPFESVALVTLREHSMDLGRAAEAGKRAGSLEAAMFTKDRGLVFLRYRVRYKISDAPAYLGRAENPESLLEHLAEATMRKAVAGRDLNRLLQADHTDIQEEVLADVAKTLEPYSLGLTVTSAQLISVEPPVGAAEDFKALADALAEKARLLEEARALHDNIVSAARREAEAMVRRARLESAALVREAEVQALRVGLLAEEYRRNPAGTGYALGLILARPAPDHRTGTPEPDAPAPEARQNPPSGGRP